MRTPGPGHNASPALPDRVKELWADVGVGTPEDFFAELEEVSSVPIVYEASMVRFAQAMACFCGTVRGAKRDLAAAKKIVVMARGDVVRITRIISAAGKKAHRERDPERRRAIELEARREAAPYYHALHQGAAELAELIRGGDVFLPASADPRPDYVCFVLRDVIGRVEGPIVPPFRSFTEAIEVLDYLLENWVEATDAPTRQTVAQRALNDLIQDIAATLAMAIHADLAGSGEAANPFLAEIYADSHLGLEPIEMATLLPVLRHVINSLPSRLVNEASEELAAELGNLNRGGNDTTLRNRARRVLDKCGARARD
jgi:hypothetical protein